MDLGGTSVSEMDVDLLERLLTGAVRDVGGGEKEDVGTLSPLTATQKTHNTTQFTHTQQCHGVDAKEIEAATEALMLVRWIGKQGINVIMRQNKVARVLFGIMLPKDDGNDELLEQYVVRSAWLFYLHFFGNRIFSSQGCPFYCFRCYAVPIWLQCTNAAISKLGTHPSPSRHVLVLPKSQWIFRWKFSTESSSRTDDDPGHCWDVYSGKW
eukprot:scaffold165087_cov58-Cyclotella_meneghiniana.AAC.1